MFDHFRQRLSGEPKPVPELVELRPEDAAGLSLSWNSHFNTPSLRQHLLEYPGLSLRPKGYDEYIIGDNWRKHDGIGQILETKARLYRSELVEGLVAEFRRRGYGAVILGNDEYNDYARFYAEAGFKEIERIVYYEKPDMQINYVYQGAPVLITPYSAELEEDLLKVDHASFPWLWHNSRKELEQYADQEDVNIYLSYDAEGIKPLGYFSFTMYERWAHLDRLAVVPEMHGQGLGALQLERSIRMMEQYGARRVTLSTQLTNHQSQRLYEGFGFRRVRSLEYSLVGRWLNDQN